MKLFLLVAVLFLSLTSNAAEVVNSFAAPGAYTTGLAWGNGTLWALDASTNYVYELDPETGSVISSFFANVSSIYALNGLAYQDGMVEICSLKYGVLTYIFFYTDTGTYLGYDAIC